jgi:hypothetical protein
VASFLTAIRSRQTQRRDLLARINSVAQAPTFDAKAVLSDLQARLHDWRELLQDRRTPKARWLLSG